MLRKPNSEPSGRYVIMNDKMMRRRAARKDDPRHIFYEALLEEHTYEGFLRRYRDVKVQPETYRTRPVSGLMELLYCRNSRGWIKDRDRITLS